MIAYAVNQALLEDPFRPLPEAVAAGLQQLHGAYSLLIAFPDRLIAVRDPHGFRPLCMGRRGDQTVFASESCALDAVGAAFVRDLEPGELISVDAKGPAVHWVTGARPSAVHPGQLCVFEFVYFARADSVIHGCSVQEARLRAGRLLAKEQPRDADVVIGVRSAVEGKRVVMIDDSIVRGTTCRHLVDMLREAGAREVHMLVSSPPFRFPCFYGTDVSSGEALIACRLTVEETAREIGADSLGYLSLESVVKIAEQAACGFCTACFSGVYPHEDEQPAKKPAPSSYGGGRRNRSEKGPASFQNREVIPPGRPARYGCRPPRFFPAGRENLQKREASAPGCAGGRRDGRFPSAACRFFPRTRHALW